MIPFARARYYLSDKGLQQKTSEFLITSRELQIARNVHFYEQGSWTKRLGYIKRFTGTPSVIPITGMYNFIKRDLTPYYLSTSDALYTSNQADIAPSIAAGGLTFTPGTEGENLMSFVNFNNKAIGTNGVEALWQFNGTTGATLAGSPPIAPVMATFQNFIFLAGNPTFPYRLYFCNDGDETTWSAADYIDIGDLTQGITGLSVLFGKLYIFLRKGMHELRGYDRDTFAVDIVSSSTGCVARKSIVKVDNNLVFLSERGFYSFDGINVHYLSETIQLLISSLNYNRIDKVVGEIYKAKDQVWFGVSTGSNLNNNEIICMSYSPTASESAGLTKEDVSFAEYTGILANSFGLERSAQEQDRLYTGDYLGMIYKQDTGTNDDGLGIDFVVKTPPIDMGAPEEFKRFRYLWLFTKQVGAYNLNISYKTDFKPGDTTTTVSMQQTTDATLWGSMIWGTSVWGGSSIIKARVGLKANGQHLELVFSNKVKDQNITIKGFSLLCQNKGAGRYA